MTQTHVDAFIQDLQSINPDIRLGSGWFKKASSITGLVTHLRNTVGFPAEMSVFDAQRLTGNPGDPRLAKYRPAIERLTQVWGRGAHRVYPSVFVPTTTQAARTRARLAFAQHVQKIPPDLRPSFDDLGRYDTDSFLFGANAGPRYLRQVTIAGQRVDITARSLFLAAGLLPPDPVQTDHSYSRQLELTPGLLTSMAGRSILDIGCGAAMFGAEMAALYGCTYKMIDLNASHILLAMRAARARYASSMLYLQMLADENNLGIANTDAARAPEILQCIQNCASIFTHYNYNPPRPGDIFDLGKVKASYGGGGWDYTVCAYLFCYFTPAQQTAALKEILKVTNQKVLLFNGLGSVLTNRLYYDTASVMSAFPNITIDVKNERLHHISV